MHTRKLPNEYGLFRLYRVPDRNILVDNRVFAVSKLFYLLCGFIFGFDRIEFMLLLRKWLLRSKLGCIWLLVLRRRSLLSNCKSHGADRMPRGQLLLGRGFGHKHVPRRPVFCCVCFELLELPRRCVRSFYRAEHLHQLCARLLPSKHWRVGV